MAQRRLLRLAQAGATQTVNWIVQATETYDANDPGADPENWGTEAEIAALDRELTATGSETTHFGLLATFINPPTRAFYGALIKIRPTFTNDVAPNLEVWTLKGTTWTIQRRIQLTPIARSGDTLILNCTFAGMFAADDELPDAIWITMDLLVNTGLTWLCCHLYGDCTQDPAFPDCPPGTPPEDCDPLECGVDFEDWVCAPLPEPPPGVDPNDPHPPPPPDPLQLPPILVDVAMPTTYTEEDGAFTHDCPAPFVLRFYFGAMPGGGSVKVDLTQSGGLEFAEGTSQTIGAIGVLDWTIVAGFGANDPDVGAGRAGGYFPPIEVLDHITFSFTRQLAGSVFEVAGNLLDILMYWWTYDYIYDETCALEPIDGLPAAQDPPDDAGQTTYQRVYERWLVYADTADNATAALAAEAKRVDIFQRFYDANGRPGYGLRPEDALLFQDALDHTTAILDPAFDPNTFVGGQHTGLFLDFNGLADGHVIAFRVFAVPVDKLLAIPPTKGGSPKFVNPFATARTVIPYNPAVDVQTINCNVSLVCSSDTDSDLGQRFRFFRNFTLTPQITKFGGPAIQPTAYHLARGVTEDEAFDTIALMPYPTPSSPYQQTWDPCTVGGLANRRCYQWFTSGWAYLITVRVYEPVAMPIGGTVEIDPPVVNPSLFTTFGVLPTVAGGLLELDGRWP